MACTRDTAFITLNCQHCRKEFRETLWNYQKRGRRFCSHQCYLDSKNITRDIKCQWCGKSKTVRASYVERGQYKFCSEACWRVSQLNGQARESFQRTCVTCGKTFFAKPSKSSRSHCSNKCRERQVEHKCDHCGKTFTRRASDKDARFCSNACYKSSMPETPPERIVREYLEKQGIPFAAQVQFARYVADFVIERLKIIIEADGDYWHDARPDIKKRDAVRDKYLKSLGYQVIRISETDAHSGKFAEHLSCLN